MVCGWQKFSATGAYSISADQEGVQRDWRMPADWWERLQRLQPHGNRTHEGANDPALKSVRPWRPCSSSGIPGTSDTSCMRPGAVPVGPPIAVSKARRGAWSTRIVG
jgi:hypothetical protein